MEEGLKIRIGADVSGLEAGVGKAEQSLRRLQPAGASASSALFSLNQVARDLPFGFIAIQNNLPLVVDSFQDLARQSGGTRGALKNLAASLIGPAGISFAFGAVIAGATALIQKYGSLGNAFDALVRRTAQLTDAQKKTSEGIAQELSEVSLLVAIYPKLEGQRDRQNSILKKLNEVAPTYFKGLNSEKKTVEELTAAYDKYTKSLIAKAFIDANQEKVKELAKQAADELTRLNDKEIQLAKQRDKQKNSLKDFVALEDRLLKSRTGQARGDIAVGVAPVVEKKTFDEAIDTVIQRFNKQINELLSGQEGIISKLDFGSVFEDARETAKKEKPIILPAKLRIEEAIKESADDIINRQFGAESQVEIPVKIGGVPDSTIKSFQKFGEVAKNTLDLENYKKQIKEFNQLLQFGLAQPLGDLIFNFLDKGKFSFKEFADVAIASIKRIVAQLVATKLIQLLGNLLAPGLGSLLPSAGFGIGQALNLDGISGGGINVNVSGQFFARGTDLVGVLNQSNQRIGRVG